jgi:hypothetical protein
MFVQTLRRATVAAAIATLWYAPSASADAWNDRTSLKFSEPVMIPGTTLPAGTYTFSLSDLDSDRHVVQVTSEDGSKMFARTLAVPIRRMEPKGDVVLKFAPTVPGEPPAIKAWFYPGSLYGHEFVYPEEQATKIAERTKTLVLSTDVPDSDAGKGTLHTYDASGKRGAWRADDETMRRWKEWQGNRTPTTAGSDASTRSGRSSAATAPMIQDEPKGLQVNIGDLEENPAKYSGKTITVDAEVEEVFGPHFFSIDEPRWGDLEGEVLVYMPTHLAALVREDDRVTVTGRIKPFAIAELRREWGWLEPDPDIEAEFATKQVLYATRLVGGNDNMVMVLDTRAGSTNTLVTDLGALAAARDTSMVGRTVDLTKAHVVRVAKDNGFWIRGADDRSLFVLPVDSSKRAAVQVGQTVTIDGVVLEMPRAMRGRLQPPERANQTIYVYATSIEKS